MTEKHHVHTTPGEPVAPEVYTEKNPIDPEPGANNQTDDLNVVQITVIAIVSALLLYMIIVLLEAYFYNANTAERVTKNEQPAELITVSKQQQVDFDLYTRHVVDANKKVYSLPIDEAMKKVVQERQSSGPGQDPAPGAQGSLAPVGPLGREASHETASR